MFDLEKYEKLIILFLILSLLLGLAVSFHKKSKPSVDIKVTRLSPDSDVSAAETLEGPKININDAEVEELVKLKGIGRTIAGRIVDYRTANGPFRAAEDVMKVKGVGKALFEKIKDDITTE